ncbi:hypothetical protein [Flavisphingopyxis soli]|uniref:hypothetical protein n=1 Tax=Flavisphingopyxis soli TaxID=2601267 RepID=UPI0011BEC538|nr:hypothetical protein [Sphingorhabdus soli]
MPEVPESSDQQSGPAAAEPASLFAKANARASADPQQTLMRYCMDRISYWRDRGIVEHGGARPGVSRSNWRGLDDEGRRDILETAACIQASGLPGPAPGVVVVAGFPDVVQEEAVIEVAYE